MERRHCLLLLCALGFTFGERMENDDFVSILRRFQPGLLVRDELYEDSEINSQKRLRPQEFISVSEQTKNSMPRRDANEAPGPMVLTKDGKMKGVTMDKAQVFYGIPYADPPVGAYRWKPPRPVTPWTGVYDASFPRAACMQACRGPMSAKCAQTVRNISSLFLYTIYMFTSQW